MQYEERERIGDGTKMFMLIVAIAFWLISFIPIVNFFSDITAWIVFWTWFRMNEASLSKNIGKNIASLLLGFIPVIGTFLSAFPVVIYLNIRTIQKEDAEYNAQMQEQAAQERKAQLAYLQQQYADEETLAEDDAENAVPEKTEREIANEERMAKILAKEGEQAPQAAQNARVLPGDEALSLGNDALDILNNKPDKDESDRSRLRTAARIMKTGQITPNDRNDPALLAAYNKYQNGIREFNPSTQQGYRFKSTN